MRKILKITAFALAFALLACAFSPALAKEEQEPFQAAAHRLFAWGIIDSADLENVKNKDKKLDRHVFALWAARVLSSEFEAERYIYMEGDGGELSTAEEVKTGFADVDRATEPLYRKAIIYVTDNGIFRGYGEDRDGNKYFGAYRADSVPAYTDGAKNGGKVELYQALTVALRLLSRAHGELDTSYLDDAEDYAKCFGSESEALKSSAMACLWKCLGLGIVDKIYTEGCAEYRWDAELSYAEAAYILERTVAKAVPALYADEAYKDANGNGICDFCLAEGFEPKNRKAVCTGEVISASDMDGDGVLDADGTLSIKLATASGGEITLVFAEDEFDDMAYAKGKNREVSLENNGEGYAEGAAVTMEYYGDILLLEKPKYSDEDIEKLKLGFLAAVAQGGTESAPTVLPVR